MEPQPPFQTHLTGCSTQPALPSGLQPAMLPSPHPRETINSLTICFIEFKKIGQLCGSLDGKAVWGRMDVCL